MYAASIYFPLTGATALFVRPSLNVLKADMMSAGLTPDKVHWRIADKTGWIDGSEGAWEWCPPIDLPGFDYVSVSFQSWA